jgi:hypothetical protein
MAKIVTVQILLCLILCLNELTNCAVRIEHEEVGSALAAWFRQATEGLNVSSIDISEAANSSSVSSSIFRFQKLSLNFTDLFRDSEAATLRNRYDGIHLDYQLPVLTYKFEVNGMGDKDTYPFSICSQCSRTFILKLRRARENGAPLEIASMRGRPSQCGYHETEITPLFMVHRRTASYAICSELDEYRANIISSAIKINDLMQIIDPIVANHIEQMLRNQDNSIVTNALRDVFKFHGVDILNY